MFDQQSNWMDNDQTGYEESTTQSRRRNRTAPRRRHDKGSANCYGDTVFRDMTGKITAFRYNQHGTYYSFEYDKDGKVNSINRSDGWVWRKVNTTAFKGWVVRNYFETWKVDEQDCGAVTIDENGVNATGDNADLMGLPLRTD